MGGVVVIEGTNATLLQLLLLSRCFTPTETVCLVMVFYDHINRMPYYGALRPQKPYS